MIQYVTANPNLGDATGIDELHPCPICGYQNPAEIENCLHCGTILGLACPVCAQPAPSGNKFCEQCGAALPDSQVPPAATQRAKEVRQNLRALMPTALAQKISAAAGEILGEQRDVTVLYLNVLNATTSGHMIDNEDSFLLMDQALRLLVDVVYKYEGAIDKLTGDGLVALFGAPVAHENDPERAVRAALEMQSILDPWRQKTRQASNFDFQIRLGINTGPVIAGKVGNDLHMDYTVIGETVNLAAHLQLVAEPGAILVSPETYQRTRPLFEFETRPPVSLNWLPQPIQAFEPLALRAEPARMGGSPSFPTPLIGRAQDLARLQNALTTVCREHQPQVALVTGEAGLGKSRLVAEFRRTIHAVTEVKVFQGNCLTYARSTPMWVVTDLLRNLAQLSEANPDDVQRAGLAAYLARLGLADNPDILPYLVHLLGMAQAEAELETRLGLLEPDMLQRQTYAALRQLLLAQARQAPTVLIFEDLHWLDPASSDFMAYLIRTIDEVPLLLLLVSREAERDTTLRPLLAALESEPARLVDLQLQALSAAEGQLLADQLIPQSTVEAGALKQQLIARTEGNPFYIEEIIRMLIDQGGLARTPADTGWQVRPQAQELLKNVPGTVKGLILARFDRLPERLRWSLQKAAVLGASFPVSLLHDLVNVSPDTLDSQLSRLEARQFLTATPFRSAPGCAFRHALVQETIYQTLLKRDRRKIHTQVGQAIEQSTFWLAEEQAEILAYHYSESDNPLQALPFLIRAADNAAGRCAFETAIAHYRQAITLLPEQPAAGDEQYFKVRLGLGRALKFVGELVEAGQVLSESLERLAEDNQAALKPLWVENLRLLADVRQREGDFEQALPYLETGLELLGPDGRLVEPELWRSLLDRMAWIRFRQGDLEEAWILASLATAGQNPADTADPIRLASLYNTQGGVAWQQGRLDESIAFVRRSLDLYEKLGYSWGVAVAYGNLGLLYNTLSNWLKATEYFERAYTMHQIIGNPEGQAVVAGNMAVLHTSMGEHELARRELETGLSIQTRLGDHWGMAQSHVNLAHLALVQSRFEDSATHAQTALVLADTIGSAEIRVPVHWCLALVQAEQNELPKGLEYAWRSLEMAREAEFIEGEIDAHRVLGILQSRAGEYVQADVHLRQSIELSVKQKVRYRQGLALLELGRLAQRRAQSDQAAASEWRAKAVESLDEAADIFESLGAGHDLHLARLARGEL